MRRWITTAEREALGSRPGTTGAFGWVHPKTGLHFRSDKSRHADQAREMGFDADTHTEANAKAIEAGYTRWYVAPNEIGVEFNKDCPLAPLRAKALLAYHAQNQQGRMLLADTGKDYYHGTSLKDAHAFIDRVSTKLKKGRRRETDYARTKRALGESADEPQIDWHLKFPERAYISWFKVPKHQRGQGVGRAAYEKWEKNLPASVTHIELHAADSGNGPSDGFWQKMGFTHRYDYEEPPHPSSHEYEHSQLMHKGIRGHKTPETEFISADEMQESRADTLIRMALNESVHEDAHIINAMHTAKQRGGYLNCKLAVQMATGIPKVTELPKVKKHRPGDVLSWGPTHYAIALSNNRVVHVPEWGGEVETAHLDDLKDELGPPQAIHRPPPGVYRRPA